MDCCLLVDIQMVIVAEDGLILVGSTESASACNVEALPRSIAEYGASKQVVGVGCAHIHHVLLHHLELGQQVTIRAKACHTKAVVAKKVEGAT